MELGYGKKKINIEIPEKNLMAVLKPNEVKIERTGIEEVDYALANPIGSEPLHTLVKAGQKVVIITSDITRPVPSYKILPSILRELNRGGIPDSDITVVLALGCHRSHTEEEKIHLVGEEVYKRVKCEDSDANNVVKMGVTKNGTPVDVYKTVAEADFRVLVGNIEYHYFAGYSGGMKAIMPGVSTPAAIQANHSKMIYPEAAAGRLEGNPVREDIEEVYNFCKGDFIVNVVLDSKKEIIKAVAGDRIVAHREGCKFLDSFYKIQIPKLADIVVVTPGGFPKDINMYQAQKALDNAGHAVREGGVIVWLAECLEEFGSAKFEEWMKGHEKSSDMITHIREDFQLGGHKAAAVAMILEKAKIILVSAMDDETVRKIHLQPAASLDEAMNKAYNIVGKDANIIVMPFGGSTLPVV